MEKIIELLQQVLDISKSQDSNELSLTTDLEEDIEIFIRKTNEREEEWQYKLLVVTVNNKEKQ